MLREKVTNVISKKPILFLTFFEMTRTHFLFQTQCACHTNQISSILAYHGFQLDSECNRLKWWHSDGKTDTSNGSIAHLLHRHLISLQNMNVFIYVYNIYIVRNRKKSTKSGLMFVKLSKNIVIFHKNGYYKQVSFPTDLL